MPIYFKEICLNYVRKHGNPVQRSDIGDVELWKNLGISRQKEVQEVAECIKPGKKNVSPHYHLITGLPESPLRRVFMFDYIKRLTECYSVRADQQMVFNSTLLLR